MTPEQFAEFIQEIKALNIRLDYMLLFMLLSLGNSYFRIACLGKNQRNLF